MPAIAYLNWVPVHNKAQVKSWQAHIKRNSLRPIRCLWLQIKMSIAYLCSKYELRLYSCLSRLIVIHWVVLSSSYCNFTCKSMTGPSSKLLAVQNLGFNSNLKVVIQYSLRGQIRKNKAKKTCARLSKASTDASRTLHSDLKSWCRTWSSISSLHRESPSRKLTAIILRLVMSWRNFRIGCWLERRFQSQHGMSETNYKSYAISLSTRIHLQVQGQIH